MLTGSHKALVFLQDSGKSSECLGLAWKKKRNLKTWHLVSSSVVE